MAVSSAGKGSRDEQKTLAATKEDLKQRQHEDCMMKYNEIQTDKKLRPAYLRTENKKQDVFDCESWSD